MQIEATAPYMVHRGCKFQKSKSAQQRLFTPAIVAKGSYQPFNSSRSLTGALRILSRTLLCQSSLRPREKQQVKQRAFKILPELHPLSMQLNLIYPTVSMFA